ncbi:hypothetical protein FBQ97_10650 [Acidobacteria bacterium ACD]|nr:MAG: hypothetical protein EDX89_10435 [Acidobacteriota bacterium]MCE7958000.1 hypothetical protein [Acidobacteria bacterium ACB2]MDL1950259.1 hypothetical protein [Acidobacteria bacterium ACD]
MLVESRADLLLAPLVDAFLTHTDEEDPKLARELRKLDAEGRNNLGGILGRFDERRTAALDATERLLARRVLLRLRRPTTQSFVLTNKILDYLDLNADSLLSEKEVALCVEIFERCSALGAAKGTLSERELKRVYSILRHLDADDDHALNARERAVLRQALEDPAKFFERYHEESQVLHRAELAAHGR